MSKFAYLAIIEKTKGSDFSVLFPDVPGCYSAGKTLLEARLFAEEALAVHLEGVRSLPVTRSLKAILDDPTVAEVIENAVEIIEVPFLALEAAE